MISIKFRGADIYIFPNRIKFKTPGYHVYELRGNNNVPSTIEENVLTNFLGSVLTKSTIKLNKNCFSELTQKEQKDIMANINNHIYELKELEK